MLRSETLADQVADLIRGDILVGNLPPGQLLHAETLADRYGVSTTPVREAVQRLGFEALVRIDRRRGAKVRELDLDEARDIYRARRLIEPGVLASSIEHGGSDWQDSLRSASAELDSAEARLSELHEATDDTRRSLLVGWIHAHRAFHGALHAACDSPWLLRIEAILADQSDRYRVLSLVPGMRDVVTHQEHSELLQAALCGDVAAALDVHRRHLDGTIRFLDAVAPDGQEQGQGQEDCRSTVDLADAIGGTD